MYVLVVRMYMAQFSRSQVRLSIYRRAFSLDLVSSSKKTKLE